VETGILDAMRSIPGVLQAAGTDDPELAGNSDRSTFSVQGYVPAEEENMHFENARTTPGYFETLRQPLLAGRDFSPADVKDSPKVAIINLALARRFFGTPQNALGRMIAEDSHATKFETTIVGVVGDVKHRSMRETTGERVYLPYFQASHPGGLRLYALTSQDPVAVESAIRERIHRLDPKLVVSDMLTMEEQVNQSVSNERALALLATSFSGLALLMTAVGLYGVLAFATAQRTREIGLRMALGAQRSSVVLLVLREMALTSVIAIAVALPAAVGLSRLMQTLLYGVEPGDPVTLAACVLASIVMILLSAAIPARRAASVDPMRALRSE